MIIRFDSLKQKGIWFLILVGWIGLGWVFKIIFKYYDEAISLFFGITWGIWMLLGKYILRLFKVN